MKMRNNGSAPSSENDNEEDNPLVWMLEVNGFVIDIRHAPREAQVVAYQKGLIPWIPADRPKPPPWQGKPAVA